MRGEDRATDAARWAYDSRVWHIGPQLALPGLGPVDRLDRLGTIDRLGRLRALDRLDRVGRIDRVDRFLRQRGLDPVCRVVVVDDVVAFAWRRDGRGTPLMTARTDSHVAGS